MKDQSCCLTGSYLFDGTNGDLGTACDAACTMVDVFASVGAQAFDLTLTTRTGAKVWYRGQVSLENLRRMMPAALCAAIGRQHNVIVRPRAASTAFVQLDDLSADSLNQLRPVAFLSMETSPANYQAWVATSQGNRDLALRLRILLGADVAASGATRVAGSFNFKDKYAPTFPRVEIRHSSRQLIATPEQFARFGAPIIEPHAIPITGRRKPRWNPRARKWPSYRRCVDGAPLARNGSHPDISRADFTWCMIALDWGWGIEETAARLMVESPKARTSGERYAVLTSERAAAARFGNVFERLTQPGGFR